MFFRWVVDLFPRKKYGLVTTLHEQKVKGITSKEKNKMNEVARVIILYGRIARKSSPRVCSKCQNLLIGTTFQPGG